MKSANRLIRLLGMVVLGIAVYQELQKPSEERTWHGKVADTLPYDLRLPTLERVKERLWNPSDPRIFMPAIFGVGWTVNVGRINYLLTCQTDVETPQQTV